QDVQEMDPAGDIDACRARIESAINDGRLQLTVSDGDVSARVRDKAIETVKDRAAKLLQRMFAATDPDLDAAHLLASAKLADTRPVKLVREADVGRWFTSGNTVKLFMAATPPPAHKGTLNRTFKLGFEAKDFPIAFVQLASGKEKEALRPPAFSPVTMSVEAAKPVTVTTNYTDGGPAYQVQVDAGDETPLTAQQLGFFLISIDGTARKEAGAKQLKMRVKYIPEGSGSEDEHRINWGFGDWTDSWYFVSRDSGLGGVIEYSWEETASDGTVVDHPPLKTSQTQLKL